MIIFQEEGGTMHVLPDGAVVIAQRYENWDEILKAAQELLDNAAMYMPLPFRIEDTTLRLLPAADDGNGNTFGYVEVSV